MPSEIGAAGDDLTAQTVKDRIRGVQPGSIGVHWVEVEGVRFPVLQALRTALGVSWTDLNSHSAIRLFRKLGFRTSDIPAATATTLRTPTVRVPQARVGTDQASAAFSTLAAFLRGNPLAETIGKLEYGLVDAQVDTVADLTAAAGLTPELLGAALIVRRDVGRVSDVIHATAIALALPLILEPGEVVKTRPSLAAGNDATRIFDLQTDRRVAEFKLALWTGGNRMRQRGVTADLVHLALHNRGLRPELWVAGSEPIRFLTRSTSPVHELLSRSSRHLQAEYTAKYGPDPIAVRDFVADCASNVELHDISEVLPGIGADFA